ncbi:MAG: hypothetical protein ACOZEN_12245 [Thermodesulfobacteriota bacterium]
MAEETRAPHLFSPVQVVLGSLAFTAANLPAIARWSAAPLLYGLGFHYATQWLRGERPGGEIDFTVLLLLGVVLLWIRVPLELRVVRKVLLGENPGQFYGLELVEKRTWTYLWAYVRVMCLVVAVLGPAMILGGVTGQALLSKAAEAFPEWLVKSGPVLGAFAILALVYFFLAPRIAMVFPDVALGGPGFLFRTGRLGDLALEARWRIVAVMAMVWTPEHAVNAMSYLLDEAPWWQAVTGQWWFTLASYLLGFATLVVSCVAGAMIYGFLRSAAGREEPEPEQEPE